MKRIVWVSLLLVFGLGGCALKTGADQALLAEEEPCPVSPIVEGFWEGIPLLDVARANVEMV